MPLSAVSRVKKWARLPSNAAERHGQPLRVRVQVSASATLDAVIPRAERFFPRAMRPSPCVSSIEVAKGGDLFRRDTQP